MFMVNGAFGWPAASPGDATQRTRIKSFSVSGEEVVYSGESANILQLAIGRRFRS